MNVVTANPIISGAATLGTLVLSGLAWKWWPWRNNEKKSASDLSNQQAAVTSQKNTGTGPPVLERLLAQTKVPPAVDPIQASSNVRKEPLVALRPTEAVPKIQPTQEQEPPAPTQEQEPPAPTEQEPPAPTQEQEPPAPAEQEPPAPTEQEPPAPTEQEPPAPTQEQEPPAPTEQEPPAPTQEQEPPAPTVDETVPEMKNEYTAEHLPKPTLTSSNDDVDDPEYESDGRPPLPEEEELFSRLTFPEHEFKKLDPAVRKELRGTGKHFVVIQKAEGSKATFEVLKEPYITFSYDDPYYLAKVGMDIHWNYSEKCRLYISTKNGHPKHVKEVQLQQLEKEHADEEKILYLWCALSNERAVDSTLEKVIPRAGSLSVWKPGYNTCDCKKCEYKHNYYNPDWVGYSHDGEEKWEPLCANPNCGLKMPTDYLPLDLYGRIRVVYGDGV